MLDKWSIKIIRFPLSVLCKPFEWTGITADRVTVAGFFIKIGCVPGPGDRLGHSWSFFVAPFF